MARVAFLIIVLTVGVYFLIEKEESVGNATQLKTQQQIIEEDLQTLYQKYGEYVQVTPDGRILVKDTEVTETQIKNRLPARTQVISYEAPEGKGYQVITETATQIISFGFGVEAESRTYTINKTIPIASTTP